MRIIILTYLFIAFQVCAQKKQCLGYYMDYCVQTEGCDTIRDRYSANTIHFCEGVFEALKSDSLALKFSGMRLYSPCRDYSYSRKGIQILGGGCCIGEGEMSHNAGFNYIMKQRIIDELGQEEYDLLGEIDSNWLFAKREDLTSLKSCFITKDFTDSTYFIRLDTSLLSKTRFRQLDQVFFEIKSSRQVDVLNSEQLYTGVTLILGGPWQLKTIVTIDFSNYVNEQYEVCSNSARKYVFILEIKQDESEDAASQHNFDTKRREIWTEHVNKILKSRAINTTK